MKRILMLLLLGGALGYGCKPDATKTAKSDPASVAAVRAQLDVLRDSVDASWQRMTAIDDNKVNTTSLLLQDLSKQSGVNATQVQALARANDRLRQLRYDQTSMASSDKIDQYDNAQDSLFKALYPVAAPEGNAPTERVRDMTESIQASDAKVVQLRAEYDRAAITYNNYLRLHQAEMQTLGGKYAELKPLPLFTVNP